MHYGPITMKHDYDGMLRYTSLDYDGGVDPPAKKQKVPGRRTLVELVYGRWGAPDGQQREPGERLPGPRAKGPSA